jgi:hypothetical protein
MPVWPRPPNSPSKTSAPVRSPGSTCTTTSEASTPASRLIRRTRGGALAGAEFDYVDLVWHECEFRERDSFSGR